MCSALFRSHSHAYPYLNSENVSHCSANVPALSLSPPATKEELQELLPKQQQHLPLEMAQEPAVPCSKCGWFHRRTLEEVQAGREAVRAAKQRPRKRKQTYAVRREDVRYRFSMFKAQATRRGKEVELLRHDYARILRQPCLYCSSMERIGVDSAKNDGIGAMIGCAGIRKGGGTEGVYRIIGAAIGAG